MGRDHGVEKLEKFEGGGTRSQKPRYGLIPKVAIDALAARFELGQNKYGPGSWNALSPNYETTLTRSWVRAGLEHVIGHCYVALQKLEGLKPEDGDDDAGAIMFGGAVLAAYKALHTPTTQHNLEVATQVSQVPSTCGSSGSAPRQLSLPFVQDDSGGGLRMVPVNATHT